MATKSKICGENINKRLCSLSTVIMSSDKNQNMETKIYDQISKSIVHFNLLVRNFSENYLSFLINLYCNLIGQHTIRYKIVDFFTTEPIFLVGDRKQNEIIHLFSQPAIEYLISCNSLYSVTNAQTNAPYVKLHKDIIMDLSESIDLSCKYEKIKCPEHLTKKLLRLFCLANHSALHFINLQNTNKTNYTHTTTKITKTSLISVDDLITRVSNTDNESIITGQKNKQHKRLKLQDQCPYNIDKFIGCNSTITPSTLNMNLNDVTDLDVCPDVHDDDNDDDDNSDIDLDDDDNEY